MKKLIYIFMMLVAAAFAASCSGYNDENYTSPNNEQDTTTPTDTLSWENVKNKGFYVEPNTMMAYANIEWHCTNGGLDSCKMEPWLLDINTMDLVVYRDSYQPSTLSGKSLDAEKSSSEEFKDKYNNLVKDHSYSQKYEFKNFTHSISGAWRTGRLFYGNGREENYLPEDGLYYEVSVSGNTVNDTVHTVRNDSIFAIENVKLTYTATLKVDPAKPHTWLKYERSATVTVISFIGLVEHEPEIPTAEHYVANLQWHAASGNRFYKKISENTKSGDTGYWEDGFLMSSDTHYILLIVHYTVDAKDGKSDERLAGKEIITIPKDEMSTPAEGREYNAVMYDWQRKRYIPCCLSKDHNFSYGSRYADGSPVSYQPDTKGSVMDGVKNFAKDNDASPTPWLETACVETQYNGKNYYTITLKSSVHTSTTTVADSSLK